MANESPPKIGLPFPFEDMKLFRDGQDPKIARRVYAEFEFTNRRMIDGQEDPVAVYVLTNLVV